MIQIIPPLAIPLAWLITTTMHYCNCVWQTKLQNQRHEALKMLNKLKSEENKMTDEEIVKALECCQINDESKYIDCPYCNDCIEKNVGGDEE